MMKYVVESFYDDAKVTVETNDPEVAILEMMQRDMEGVHAHCVDGLTGEVLALVNHPGQFAQPEFALMTLGVLMAHQWEEDESEEPAETPADPAVALLSAIFGVSADEVVALHNGEGLPS